jgi:hypothetical protein
VRYYIKPKSKYGATPTKVGDVQCASKLEANYYKHLELLQKAGEVKFFLFQVPFRLEGGVRYIVDFVVFHSDGKIEFIDTKGRDTPLSILKRKQVEARYPVEIRIVRKV